MIFITIKEDWTPWNLDQITNFFTIYLCVVTHDLEIRDSGMLNSVGNSQLKLRFHIVMKFCISFFIDYFQLIVVRIIIRDFLESPIFALSQSLQCTNKFQFQLAIFSSTILCDSAYRPLDAFPWFWTAHQLAEQYLGLFAAERFSTILITISQDAMITPILTFQLTSAFLNLIIGKHQHVWELVCIIQLCKITSTARYGIIHY